MKILIANTLYYPIKVGGAEVSVQLLAEEMVASGHEVHVLTLSKDGLPISEVVNGVVVHRIKLANLYWPFPKKTRRYGVGLVWHVIDCLNVFMFSRLNKVVRIVQPDIMHTNNLLGLSVMAWLTAKINGVPIVHTSRDYYLICPKSSMYTNNKRCERQCFECKVLSYPKKVFSAFIDSQVGISQFIFDIHHQYGVFKGNRQGGVVYNVSGGSPPPERVSVEMIKRIGFIGSIAPSKGVEAFLKMAIRLLSVEGGRYEFYLAGSGQLDFVRSLKNDFSAEKIHFLGHVNPLDFYKTIDVLLVPSDWDEPFGRVVVEAFSFNKPVIVSPRGGLPELVFPEYVLDFSSCSLADLVGLFKNIESNGYRFKRLVSKSSYGSLYENVIASAKG